MIDSVDGNICRMNHSFGLPIAQQSLEEANKIALANFYEDVGVMIDEMIRAGLPNPYDEMCMECPCEVEE